MPSPSERAEHRATEAEKMEAALAVLRHMRANRAGTNNAAIAGERRALDTVIEALTAWNTRPSVDREGVVRALRETVMPKSVRITQYAGHVYDFGSLPGITDEIVGLLADALTPELPEGPLHPRGFMPYWTKASDVEMAVYGLSYILQQIQATNTYKPNIGQAGAAMSSLEFAIRRLRDGASSRPPVTSDAVPGTNKETDQ